MEKDQFFCPNCGTKISRSDVYCPECGYNIKKYLDTLQDQPAHQKPAATPKSTPHRSTQPVRRAPRKPIKKWQTFTGVAIIIILVGGYLFLNNYYGKKATANRLVTAIKQDQGKALAALITSNDPSFKPTSSNVEPMVTYYNQNKDKLATLKSDLTTTGFVNDRMRFVDSGHHFFVFHNYKLKVKPLYPQIQTNKKNAKLKINDNVVANQMNTTDPKKFGPYIPGEYHIQTSATVHGHKLVNNGDYSWINPSNYDLDIQSILQTISYSVKGQPGSKVYLSGKEIGKIGSNGYYDIKNYPFSQNMTISLSLKTQSGKVVNSQKTKVDMSMNNTTITPQYSGFATTDEASDLINSIWGDISDGTVTDTESANDDDYADYFIGGSTSVNYQEMIKMVDGYQKDDDILDYEMEPSIKSVVPYDVNQTKVVYDVKYTFDNDDHYHIQIFEYDAIIQKSGSGYKLKSNTMDHKVDDYDKDE
ncbi:zinc-ribbon domain-containing protein [Lentilactobacillus parafarraginis]|uniref:Zinc-ribbon domain-containing protein n=1 Tax=Lentilactobacillus parafarraginis TaxID=390842 RepID=A0A5R9CRM3_9LACO|nr:zinc-ribbon domain-containing protein [Lentilactobacillus parafarraginis]TLQ17964.1 zinc-ribbon domain-containing protein [Lentilactobacillus parafarraginis]